MPRKLIASEWTWTLPAARSKNKRPRVTPSDRDDARDHRRHGFRQSESGRSSSPRRGAVLTSAHIGHYLLARYRQGYRSKSSRRTICGAPWRPCWRKWESRSILIAAVVGHEAGGRDTRTLVRHYVRTDLIERKVSCVERPGMSDCGTSWPVARPPRWCAF